jgi:hypothetical protein
MRFSESMYSSSIVTIIGPLCTIMIQNKQQYLITKLLARISKGSMNHTYVLLVMNYLGM